MPRHAAPAWSPSGARHQACHQVAAVQSTVHSMQRVHVHVLLQPAYMRRKQPDGLTHSGCGPASSAWGAFFSVADIAADIAAFDCEGWYMYTCCSGCMRGMCTPRAPRCSLGAWSSVLLNSPNWPHILMKKHPRHPKAPCTFGYYMCLCGQKHDATSACGLHAGHTVHLPDVIIPDVEQGTTSEWRLAGATALADGASV